MHSVSKNGTVFLAACCCFIALHCFALPAIAASHWAYHEEKYEAYTPQISPDNKYLVFVRRLYFPSGFEAEIASEKDIQALLDWAETNKRTTEPEIVLMNLADKSMRVIGQGWDPAFSPDQRSIAYSRQVHPIAGWITAKTLADNAICVYDIAGGTSQIVAEPSSGHFAFPRFTEKGHIVFAMSDAVNGAWEGDVGVGMVDPAEGTQQVLFEPKRDHGLYHLLLKFEMWNDRIFVLRLRPLDAGTSRYMADNYAYELVEGRDGTLLYNWGDKQYDPEMRVDFRTCPSGVDVYGNGGWRKLGDAPSPNTKKRTPRDRTCSSPDCAYEAMLRGTQRVVIMRSGHVKPAFQWKAPRGVIQSVTWSPDSSRIVLVINHGTELGEKDKFTELVILTLRDMRGGK